MQIESIEIRNYRLFRKAILEDLPRLTIVVGANGSGKSTLFDVFSFLKEALARNVAVAVTRRGGFRELVSGGQVFVSTHSPDFLNGAHLDEIYWLDKKDDLTTIRLASDSELILDAGSTLNVDAGGRKKVSMVIDKGGYFHRTISYPSGVRYAA